MHLEALLLRLYRVLDYERKMSIIIRYASLENLELWTLFNIEELSATHTFKEAVTLKLVDETERLNNGSIDHKGLFTLVCLDFSYVRLHNDGRAFLVLLLGNPPKY